MMAEDAEQPSLPICNWLKAISVGMITSNAELSGTWTKHAPVVESFGS